MEKTTTIRCVGIQAILVSAALLCVAIAPSTAQDLRQFFGSSQRSMPGGGTMLGVPEGFMMAGCQADQNQVTGSKLLLPDGHQASLSSAATFSDGQRFGMLSTQEGFVAVGVHEGQNKLLQQSLPKGIRYRYYFSFADETFGPFRG